MKKILALAFLLIFPAVCWGADSVTLHVNGTDFIASPDVVSEYVPYVPAVMSGDEEITPEEPEEIGAIIFPAVSGTNYTFSTVQSALEFANDPKKYIETYYRGSLYPNPSYDVTFDPSLEAAMSTLEVAIEIRTIDSTVKMSEYDALTDITFTATAALASSARHFIVDNPTAAVTFNSITFSGNSSGGGVEVSAGTVTFTTCAFRDCYASSNGGGVSVIDGTVTFTRCTFNNCEASNGGGVAASGGTVTMTSPRFSGGNATSRGGAVSISDGSVTITGAAFSNNTASDYGGAISATGGTTSISGSSTFSGNWSDYGGAISLTGGTMSLLYSSFTNNTASSNGGAIYSSSGLTIGAGITFNTMTDSAPNKATNGGAIYIASGTTTISGAQAEFTENSASDKGGAIYIATGTLNLEGNGIAFKGNSVSNDGGAIWAGSGATVNLEGDNLAFTENHALSGDGGAFYIDGRGTVNVGGTSPDISANTAEEGRGGAFFMAGGSTLNLSVAMRLSENVANYGGCIYMAYARNATNLNITGSEAVTFTQNDAAISGGAIYSEANCNIIIEPEIYFTSNHARNGNGGAIWISDALQLPSGTVYFDSNAAGLPLPVTPSPAVEWPANGNGGAIYSASSSNAVIGTDRDYRFIGTNTARYHGGALSNYSGDITIQGYVLSRSITVRNSAGLGGGLAASCVGTITVNNSSIMNQSATNGSGGAIWSLNVNVNSADFGAEGQPNESRGSSNTGGGAIYIHTNGTAILNNAKFSNNTAYQGGGAVYANAANVTVRNSYFHNNTAQNGNGGAVILRNNCTTSIISSTFLENKSEYLDGGAIFSQGTISINLSSFTSNTAFMDGGAIYYDQAQNDNASFTISSSMLTENSTLGGDSGGSGGAMYIAAVRATITACTFAKNRIDLAGNAGEGGGVYLNTAAYQTAPNRIENCTFYGNTLNDGSAPNEDTQKMTSGGGGLSVHCEGITRIVSCTFTENAAQYGGGALYVAEGSVNLSGTLTVGNASGIYDIWSDGNIVSGGYNRIGVYGTGSGVTNFYAEARNDTDRTSYPSKGWNRTTFFSDNVLAVNERTDIGDSVPPIIGSSRAGTERLLTLMLKEEETLPLEDRATNIIPYSRRQSFPNTDERGVSRVSDSGEINIDIGACFFDGTRFTEEEEEIAAYTISRVEISGIPNDLRRVGQTASLIAKVYYTNGRTALGGTGSGEEPVIWTSDKPNIISINETTGDITVLNFTPGNTYVTITVTTERGDLSGHQISDSKAIRVTEYTASYLNTSSELAEFRNYLDGYNEGLTEYDILLQLAKGNTSAVTSSAFQSSFASVWGGVRASEVADESLRKDIFSTSKIYSSGDGYSVATGKAGVAINFAGLNEGDLFPLTYTWSFKGSELREILGYDLTGRTINADEIFSVMRVDFQSNGTSRAVVGSGGVRASEAVKAGMLTLSKTDGEAGLKAEMTAYLANVTSSGNSDGPQIVNGLLVVPDGNGNDGRISGTMWLADKAGSASNGNESGNSTPSNGNGSAETNSSSGGGGGGCNALGILPILAVILLRRKR